MLIAKDPYRILGPELGELKKQLIEMLELVFIRPSRYPYGVPILFQTKKDNLDLSLFLEYRTLNTHTTKKCHPLPLGSDYFNKLVKEKVFSKLDLIKEYYQGRIVEGDEWKTTCLMRYMSYEFRVKLLQPSALSLLTCLVNF